MRNINWHGVLLAAAAGAQILIGAADAPAWVHVFAGAIQLVSHAGIAAIDAYRDAR